MKESVFFITKLLLFIIVIAAYVATSFITIILYSFDMPKARRLLSQYVSMIGRLGMYVFGIKLTIKGQDNLRANAKMIISNHLSYLDIIIIASIYPSIFVTSKEMRESKILGELCFLGGCHFVERRNPRNLITEINEISKTIKNKINVVLFPEAKSTNGSGVVDFKKPLFEAGFKNKETFLPICLNYKKLDGLEVTPENRDYIFWYGDMFFFPHVIELLKKKTIEVELTIFETLNPDDFLNRNELADKAYALISKEYKNII